MEKMTKRQYRKVMRIQKLLGLIAVLAGIVSIPVCGMDATFAVLMIPAGLMLLCTSKVCLNIDL